MTRDLFIKDMPLFTTKQAAKQLGISYGALLVLLHRYPDLRPEGPRLHRNAMRWSWLEIEGVRQFRYRPWRYATRLKEMEDEYRQALQRALEARVQGRFRRSVVHSSSEGGHNPESGDIPGSGVAIS
ncbi:MAG: hypothetical protein DCC55_15440 [Chloroflexi bacterium]|nr:MAG: hypothetical protein DCC55_15440 [Chloroflexota bacterium]